MLRPPFTSPIYIPYPNSCWWLPISILCKELPLMVTLGCTLEEGTSTFGAKKVLAFRPHEIHEMMSFCLVKQKSLDTRIQQAYVQYVYIHIHDTVCTSHYMYVCMYVYIIFNNMHMLTVIINMYIYISLYLYCLCWWFCQHHNQKACDFTAEAKRIQAYSHRLALQPLEYGPMGPWWTPSHNQFSWEYDALDFRHL